MKTLIPISLLLLIIAGCVKERPVSELKNAVWNWGWMEENATGRFNTAIGYGSLEEDIIITRCCTPLGRCDSFYAEYYDRQIFLDTLPKEKQYEANELLIHQLDKKYKK